MGKPKNMVPPPRKAARSHEELPRHADWQSPRVVQILDAASRCFAREGLANTSVQQIAVEAGLTKSMIHYYFESKQVLILELQAFVHERYFRRVQQKLEQLAAAALPTDQRLQETLWEVFDAVSDKQFLRLQLELMAEAGRDPYMKSRMKLAQDRARSFIESGAEQVVDPSGATAFRLPPSLAFLLSSVILGIRVQEFVDGDEELARRAYGSFVAMMSGTILQAHESGGTFSPARADVGAVDGDEPTNVG
jgi:AcrR family transcriptional regulator